jgi:hypothetical protein
MKQMTDLDYIELYANRLKHDNSLFEQQKLIIDSQIRGSHSLFKNMFAGKDFKTEARKYLRSIGGLL